MDSFLNFVFCSRRPHSLYFCSFRASLETKNVSPTTLNSVTIWILVPFKLILELDFRKKTGDWDFGWIYVETRGQFGESGTPSSVESVINRAGIPTLLDILIFCRFFDYIFHLLLFYAVKIEPKNFNFQLLIANM